MHLTTDIQSAATALQNGGVILCPTDTVWGLSCLADNQKAVAKVSEIKNRPEGKSYIILFASIAQAKNYFERFPTEIIDLLNQATRPTTVILEGAKGLAQEVYGPNNSLAFRIVQDNFCLPIIKSLNKPIVSTSANTSNQKTPSFFNEIEVIVRSKVDYIALYKQDDLTPKQPSKIIKWHENGIQIIRS